ncbi:MAG: sugar phosphate nucleotidyltransferase [Candidatus Bathyarchaeia archaeon]|nr:NTP transferase domain-containing protein [Candidatus Bathyarchaeota archaeon]
MRAVILAAGRGIRLWPLTENRPKHMIPIAGKPIIQHIIQELRAEGIRKITIVINSFGEIIKKYFAEGRTLEVNIDYIHQRKIQGTADAVAQLKDQIADERFILFYGDIYLSPRALREIVAASSNMEFDAAIAAVDLPSQKNQYGVLKVEDGYVRRIEEKPECPLPTSLVNAGVYILDKRIFEGIKATRKSRRGEFELTDSITYLVKSGLKVKAIPLDPDDWVDIGRPWDLLDANEKALKDLEPEVNGYVDNKATLVGPVTIEPEAKILSGAMIEGPVYVGQRTVIGPNCYIRPYTSLGQNVRIGNGCEIKNSIIMDNTKIPHQSYVGDSIIGENCNLGAGTITGNLRLDGRTIQMNIKGTMINSGRRKLGAIVGDHVSTGVNVNLMPGVRIGSGTSIGPGITVYRDLPSNVMVKLEQEVTKIKRRH